MNSHQATQIAFVCSRELRLRARTRGLTEGLESYIVRGYLKLEIGLRVFGTEILGQSKGQSYGHIPWTLPTSIPHWPLGSVAE